MNVTRLSVYGGIGIPYGDFSGKSEAPVVETPSAAVLTGGRSKKSRPRRYKVEYNGQVFYVYGHDKAEALLTALEKLAYSETEIKIPRIKLKPVRRTRIEMVDDELGEILRSFEEENEEELIAILMSMRIH